MRTPSDSWPHGTGRTGRKSVSASRSAFTLLEVVLALSIAVGLLSVVLYFYQQIARLRDQTLADASELSAVRLFMDRLASELRTASPRSGTFRGTSNSLEFVRTQWIPPAARASGAASTALSPLRRIRYQLQVGDSLTGMSTNAIPAGIERVEESFGGGSEGVIVPESTVTLSYTSPTNAAGDASGINAYAVTAPAGPPPESIPGLATATDPDSAAPASSSGGVLVRDLKFLQFRFFDGATWIEAWDYPELPRGVEVSLASTPPPLAGSVSGPAFPKELFRRVIALPAALRVPGQAARPADDFGL